MPVSVAVHVGILLADPPNTLGEHAEILKVQIAPAKVKVDQGILGKVEEVDDLIELGLQVDLGDTQSNQDRASRIVIQNLR